jgi:hypothetical protein
VSARAALCGALLCSAVVAAIYGCSHFRRLRLPRSSPSTGAADRAEGPHKVLRRRLTRATPASPVANSNSDAGSGTLVVGAFIVSPDTICMSEPLRREIQRGANPEDAGVLPLHQPLGAGADVVERLANHDEIIPAGRGNPEALALATEELDAELGLEGLDLLAHRALGDVKLLGRAGQAFVAGGGLERPECIELRQPACIAANLIIKPPPPR